MKKHRVAVVGCGALAQVASGPFSEPSEDNGENPCDIVKKTAKAERLFELSRSRSHSFGCPRELLRFFT